MPDFSSSHASEGAPNGWGEAFAALPLENPPGDGWARVARALDAPGVRAVAVRRERRTSWAIGFASAAVLVIAAWSPLSRWLHDDVGESSSVAAATTEVPGLRGPAAPVRRVQVQPIAKPAAEIIVSDVSPTPARRAHYTLSRSERAIAQARVEPVSDREANDAIAVSTETATDSIASTSRVTDPLQKLKTQSAQLEALVTLARDDRVANVSNELLSSELDAGIAAVDAALSQSDLTEERRQDLWRQRVELLQQLAGVEATSRWLAAQGASGEATLVSVY